MTKPTTPPGQAKKDEPKATPPGQEKKAPPAPVPVPAPVLAVPVPVPVVAKPKRRPPAEPNTPRVLFLLKKRGVPYSYGSDSNGYSTSSGLANSTKFVIDRLVAAGVDASLEVAVDNNDIDRLVHMHRPTHVVIEALWVVPEKFAVLRDLHPKVRWVVRIHSEIPFLSQEGVAMEWIFGYLRQKNVSVAFNSDRTRDDFLRLAGVGFAASAKVGDRVLWLPNEYPLPQPDTPYRLGTKPAVDVGCFGAVRPLKNQLIQACAAVAFAERRGLGLRFHVNAGRVEQGGGSGLKNIRALFAALPAKYQLVEHGWLAHEDFVTLVRTMDVGLQCSFSESFNIVSADFVANGVPVVTSPEVRWLDPMHWAKPTDMDDIVHTMEAVLRIKRFLGSWRVPERRLERYCAESLQAWLGWIELNPPIGHHKAHKAKAA